MKNTLMFGTVPPQGQISIGSNQLGNFMRNELFEKKICPLCKMESFKVLFPSVYPENVQKDELLKIYKSSSDHQLMDQLVECSGCRLVYINPQVKPEIILNSYESAQDPRFFSQNEYRVRTFKKEIKKILNDVGIAPSKEVKFLDIGCAGGAFPRAVSELGMSVIGIEPSKWLCEEGKKKYQLDLRPGTLKDHQFPDKSFDFITLWDVIEHLTDPEAELTEIKRLLKDDGHLIINYPDYDSWVAKLFGRRWPFLLSVHLIYFTPLTIRKFLIKNGLEALKMRPHFQTLGLGYILERASDYLPALRWLKKIVEKLGLSQVPFFYYLGQTQVVVKKAT